MTVHTALSGAGNRAAAAWGILARSHRSSATGIDVTNIAPSSASVPALQARDQEARLLGEILRTSRLALLFGEPGSDKTALLKLGLIPLLGRRSSDRITATPRESGVVIPFPDRRRRATVRASNRREIIVYFDDWVDTPLAALRACIRRAAATGLAERAAPPERLSEILASLSSRLGANFIIVLDRFEEFLQAPPHREDIGQFANELVEAINQAQLPANFLISLNEEARPRLPSLRNRIPGFDDFSLKLAPSQGLNSASASAPDPVPPNAVVIATRPLPSESVTPPDLGSIAPALTVAAEPAPEMARLRPPPREPVKTEDVYAFIEATLALTATDIAREPFPLGEPRTDEGRACASASPTPDRLPGTSRRGGSVGTDTAAGKTRAAAMAPTEGNGSEPRAETLRMTTVAAVKWVRRLLRPLLRRIRRPGS